MVSASKRALHGAAIAMLCGSALAAYGGDSFDPNSQIGPNPNLPEPRQSLFPKVHIASIIG
jgi:hypothetical protein